METKPAKARTLRQMRQLCRPRPLVGEQLKAFFVETDRARNPHQRTRELITEALAEREDVRILFYGHRGCGKSTELNKLLSELGDAFVAVQFSVEEHMNEIAQHRQRLRNAIRQPVTAITAVEVDTVARARQLIADLSPREPNRPSAVIEFDASESRPDALLAEARGAVQGWVAEQGVVFVVDRTGAGKTEPVDFWRGLNFLRESWDALAAHVVFLLLPLNYRLLVTVADQLADWIPLRFHILGAETDASLRQMAVDRDMGMGLLSPTVARQRLAQLEPALSEALAQGVAPAVLIRRFYLPMFHAAVSLGDNHRAAALFRHVDQRSLADADRPAWWQMAAAYHLRRFELDQATQVAMRLLEYSAAGQKQLEQNLLRTRA